MTKKKYELKLCNNGSYYLYHEGFLMLDPYIIFDKYNKEDAESIVSELNRVCNENERLKKKIASLKQVLKQKRGDVE